MCAIWNLIVPRRGSYVYLAPATRWHVTRSRNIQDKKWRQQYTAKTEAEGVDLSYWSLGEDGTGLVMAIQHLRKAQSVENEAVTVQSVSKAAVMSYGLTTAR